MASLDRSRVRTRSGADLPPAAIERRFARYLEGWHPGARAELARLASAGRAAGVADWPRPLRVALLIDRWGLGSPEAIRRALESAPAGRAGGLLGRALSLALAVDRLDGLSVELARDPSLGDVVELELIQVQDEAGPALGPALDQASAMYLDAREDVLALLERGAALARAA